MNKPSTKKQQEYLQRLAAYKQFEACNSARWMFESWNKREFGSVLAKRHFNQAFAKSVDKFLEECIKQTKKRNTNESRDICIRCQHVTMMIMITADNDNDFYELIKNMDPNDRDILKIIASHSEDWFLQVKKSALERMKKELDEAEVLAKKEFQDNMDILESSLSKKKETQESSMANQ
jgi:hypothetical protein